MSESIEIHGGEETQSSSTILSSISDWTSNKVRIALIATTLLGGQMLQGHESEATAQTQAGCALTGPAAVPCVVATTAGTVIVYSISGLTILLGRIARGEIILAPRGYPGDYICRDTKTTMHVTANSILRACALTPVEFYECGYNQGYHTRYFTCAGGGTPGKEDYLPG